MMFLRIKALYFFWIVLFQIASTAASAQPMNVRYLGIEQGLSSNMVTSIFQAHDGFIWLGTHDGLNRYHGYDFKIFRKIICYQNSLTSNNINTISEDERYNMWIGGQKDINVYHPATGKFSKPGYLLTDGKKVAVISDNLVCLHKAKGNTMLAGTLNNGLFSFDNTEITGRQILLIIKGKRGSGYYTIAIQQNAVTCESYASKDGGSKIIQC